MRRWLFWIGIEWTIIAATMLSVYVVPWLAPLAIVVIGSRQQALAVLGHEAVHHAVAGQSLRANQIANLFCYWPIGVDLYGFREFHLRHHAYLGTAHDPEVQERALFTDAWTELTADKKRLLILRDMIGAGIPESLSIMRQVGGAYHWPRVTFLVVSIAAGLVLAPWLLLLWVWCVLTVGFACARARMWREHYDLGPGETHEYVAAWWERALYLPHYIWLHLEHHRHGNWSTSAWSLARPCVKSF